MSESVGRDDGRNGRKTVFAMFGFAVLMISLLFTYWHFYTAPFRPLQYAIAQQFEGSSPRVVGGKHKSHRDGNPTVLRIVVYISDDDFNPEQAVEQSEDRARKLAQLAFEYQDLTPYENLEIILLQKVPEESSRRWKVVRSIAEWQQLIGR